MRITKKSAAYLGLLLSLSVLAPGAIAGVAQPDSVATVIAPAEPVVATAVAPVAEYYFYKRRDHGSDLLTNPLRLIVNGGFGILQVEDRSNRPADIDFENGWDNLWRNLLNPVEAIEAKTSRRGSFTIGVQWHPERTGTGPLADPLGVAFLAEIAKN